MRSKLEEAFEYAKGLTDEQRKSFVEATQDQVKKCEERLMRRVNDYHTPLEQFELQEGW